MKRKMTLAMVAIMLLGSIKTLALTDDEIQGMNLEGKIEAVMAEESCSDCDSVDLMQGKIEATANVNMTSMVQEAEKALQQITAAQIKADRIADGSKSLVKLAASGKVKVAKILNLMKQIEMHKESISGDALFRAHSKITELSEQVSKIRQQVDQAVLSATVIK